ncbi:MAG: hypothetical protein EOM43_15950 [Gammaproteobacteria bacterium]|nr:hypothetical protein [Gammaproteobacteria bacterium]
MLEFQLTGVRKQQAELATRWFGFDFSRMINSRDAEHQLTVPAGTANTNVTQPIAGYTAMSKDRVTWPSVNGLPLPKGDFTVEHWALSPSASELRFMVTWEPASGGELYYINGSYDVVGNREWGIAVIGNNWFNYDMDQRAINDGQWHHYAITFTREEGMVRGRLYIDGVKRNFRSRRTSGPFNIEYAQFDPALLDVPSGDFIAPDSISGIAEFVVWKGIPGHIGKGKPATGPIRDTTRPQGQLYVTGTTAIFNVPAGVTTLYVDGIGGGGGGTATTGGGAGTLVSATLTVAPGDVLRIDPGTAGGGGSNGTSSRITLNGTLVFTANGGGAGANTGGGAALYPGGPVLGTGGRSGGTSGYYGELGGVRILWGEGRPLPVRTAPDV